MQCEEGAGVWRRANWKGRKRIVVRCTPTRHTRLARWRDPRGCACDDQPTGGGALGWTPPGVGGREGGERRPRWACLAWPAAALRCWNEPPRGRSRVTRRATQIHAATVTAPPGHSRRRRGARDSRRCRVPVHRPVPRLPPPRPATQRGGGRSGPHCCEQNRKSRPAALRPPPRGKEASTGLVTLEIGLVGEGGRERARGQHCALQCGT